MALFTQGLWIVNPTHARVDVMRADVGIQPICELLWPTDIRSEAETEANADLIAAAPMMYEALERVQSFLDIPDPKLRQALKDPNLIDSALSVIQDIQAALAKARGEA